MKNFKVVLLIVLSSLCFNSFATNYDATIDLPPRIELSLPVSGVINMVSVRVGQHVIKGENMISLDVRPFKAAKTYAQSRLDFYQAQQKESQRDLQHQQELFERTVLSQVELENAELRVKRDHAMFEGAKAQLARADYELSYSQLKAPFDALITAVLVNEGQTINNAIQSKTLISLVKQNHFIASFYVSLDDLKKLKIKSPITVMLEGNQYAAEISEISHQSVQSKTGSFSKAEMQYRIKAEFVVKSDSIPVGKNASVSID
jgi:RND family efflux transporter MFP subunit